MIVIWDKLEKKVTITGNWEKTYAIQVELKRTKYSLKEIEAMELGLRILEYTETGKYPANECWKLI